MVKRKINKSESIRQYMAENPDASANDIANALKVQPGLVYQVKSLKAKTRRKKATTKKARGSIATVMSNGAADQVVAAARLIKSCGSIAEARQALKTAEQVAAALEN